MTPQEYAEYKEAKRLRKEEKRRQKELESSRRNSITSISSRMEDSLNNK